MFGLEKYVRQFIINRKLRPTRQALQNSLNLVFEIKGPVLDYHNEMQVKREELRHLFDSLVGRLSHQGERREELIYLSLIYFSSIGRFMVKKAPEWLESWGEGFKAIGFQEISKSYIEHAKEEVGHDKWHERDVKALVQMYNEKFNKNLQVQEVLAAGNRPCIEAYTRLSEVTTGGELCYLSLAELYETEVMALDLAPAFISYCVKEVGFEVLKGLKFLNGHVVADVEHIKENIVQMDHYLKTNPDKVAQLKSVGEETIDVYADYFSDILNLAEASLNGKAERRVG
ncbi:MAG: hypothetical protein H6626_01710 [Pseudobdellovibrionaceae bacterium]|nr:MAG: hypothetical protein H6626_01710 [Pseudobdellovibrionaceae bacterium]